MGITPKSMWPAVKAMLHSVYDQPDATAVYTQFDRLLDYVSEKLPAVAEHLDGARSDILALTTFSDVWTLMFCHHARIQAGHGAYCFATLLSRAPCGAVVGDVGQA